MSAAASPLVGEYRVQVYLYDLSQGMARALSQQFLGKQIDGIWHTGIVVYGHEYFCATNTAQRRWHTAERELIRRGSAEAHRLPLLLLFFVQTAAAFRRLCLASRWPVVPVR